MPMPHAAIDAEAGAARNGGRRPTVVAAPASASSELSERPRRRSFSAQDKLRILAETDRAAETGGSRATPRREAAFCSALTAQRRPTPRRGIAPLVPPKGRTRDAD